MHKHGGRGNAFCASARCNFAPSTSRSRAKVGSYHTCFKRVVVSRFKQNQYIAIHLFSLIVSAAAMPGPAFGVSGLRDKYGLKVYPVVSAHVHTIQLKT